VIPRSDGGCTDASIGRSKRLTDRWLGGDLGLYRRLNAGRAGHSGQKWPFDIPGKLVDNPNRLSPKAIPVKSEAKVSKQPRALLKATEIDAMEPQRSVHSLNERAVRLKRSLSEMTGLSQFGFHLITLQPGRESTEYHRHLYEEECIYILSGNGEATIDDQAHEVGPGDFMGFARGGAAHTLSNTGHVPLILIVAGQRLEHDVCDLYVAGTNEVMVDLSKEDAD